MLLGAVAALLSAFVAGTAGYFIGAGHSRIAAALQNARAGLQGAALAPCPAGMTVPAPSATSPAGAALLARVLPRPAGATQAHATKQGVLSLRDYMSQLYPDDPAEQPRLIFRCFQTAAHQTWVLPNGTVIGVWLIQFGTAAGARSYILADEQANEADPANSDHFQVPGVRDGIGLGDPSLNKYGDTVTRLLGDDGNTAILINLFRPVGTDNKAAARILQAQSARLTAQPA